MGVTVIEQQPDFAALRQSLTEYLRRKFYSRPNAADLCDDIVSQAFLEVLCQADAEKLNFGYLAKAALHIAYRSFRSFDDDVMHSVLPHDCLDFLDPDDVVDEIMRREDAATVWRSLAILKEIERIVVTQRYYGDFSFNQIAQANHLNLNTVLSHHRRALEKLRIHLGGISSERAKIPPPGVTPNQKSYLNFL